MGLAGSEVADVQLFLFLQEGVALLEDMCISSGPEASLLPGLSRGQFSIGRGVSSQRDLCVCSVF